MGELSIKDGKGSGLLARVNSLFRLDVSSKSNDRIFYTSRDGGKSFNIVSINPSAVAGEYVLYLKNTSNTENLYVKNFELHSLNPASFLINEVTGTAGGTVITSSNLNLGSANAAEASSFGDGAVSGLTPGKRIGTHRNEANSEGLINYYDSLILPPGKAIAIEYDAGITGPVEVECFFHYEKI